MRFNSSSLKAYLLMLLASGVLITSADGAAFAETLPPVTVLSVQAMAKMESEAMQELHRQAERRRKPVRHQPVLLAIAGVLPELKASVLVDGSPVLFKQGQSKPLNGSIMTRRLSLQQIKPPCVSFVDAGKPHRVCLQPENS